MILEIWKSVKLWELGAARKAEVHEVVCTWVSGEL